MKQAFAVWITGLPASGKSMIAEVLAQRLAALHFDVAVLESDALRTILTPRPTYTAEERDTFYRAMTFIGTLLVTHGVPVIFDATANRRQYREEARTTIARFVEVFVDCPLAVCVQRDPKGIYRRARGAAAATVPGLQVPYEPPLSAELVVRGDRDSPEVAADQIIRVLTTKGYLTDSDGQRPPSADRATIEDASKQ